MSGAPDGLRREFELDRRGGFAQVSAQRTGANLGHRHHSVVEFSRSGQENKNKAASEEEELEPLQ
jgi:hypothetical protein